MYKSFSLPFGSLRGFESILTKLFLIKSLSFCNFNFPFIKKICSCSSPIDIRYICHLHKKNVCFTMSVLSHKGKLSPLGLFIFDIKSVPKKRQFPPFHPEIFFFLLLLLLEVWGDLDLKLSALAPSSFRSLLPS